MIFKQSVLTPRICYIINEKLEYHQRISHLVFIQKVRTELDI